MIAPDLGISSFGTFLLALSLLQMFKTVSFQRHFFWKKKNSVIIVLEDLQLVLHTSNPTPVFQSTLNCPVSFDLGSTEIFITKENVFVIVCKHFSFFLLYHLSTFAFAFI